MNIIKKNRLNYLRHTFRKKGKVTYREIYLGKKIPNDIEKIKEQFLTKCLEEDLFKQFKIIAKNFRKEWNTLPESIKKNNYIDVSVEFTYNTNAIEGSTITLDETEDLIKRRISPNKKFSDVQESISHAKTFLEVINSKDKLDIKQLLKWHSALFKDTKPDIAGKFRDYLVRVGIYLAPDWQDIKKSMDKLLEWYKTNESTMNPVEFAARMHYKFEKIHPFGDGNGRIGRLIIALILRQKGYPILIIDYKNRKSYYHALSKSENEFTNYFFQRFLKANVRYSR